MKRNTLSFEDATARWAPIECLQVRVCPVTNDAGGKPVVDEASGTDAVATINNLWPQSRKQRATEHDRKSRHRKGRAA
jgi:hypothetical protein